MSVRPAPEALRRQHDAAGLAARLPPLLLAAQRVAATVSQGVHGRRRIGPGDAFWQFRPYSNTDAASRIDWRQSARGSRLFVRETEWEAAQSVFLWRDVSASMEYRSKPVKESKRNRSELLLLALAFLMVDAGERVALLGDLGSPASHRRSLEALGARLIDQKDGPSLPPLPTGLAKPVPRHAQLILISDFLSPVDELAPILSAYAGLGLGGYVLQVLDPAEETLPFKGRIRFRSPEPEDELLVPRVQDLRSRYLDRLATHRAALGDLVRGLGWHFATHRTDQPAQLALLAAYNALTADR